ncbi:HAD hydrolase family protein [Allosphingosinicella sp.]|uniref:HAD hydrolase family protein n=1 Tax=Allosphingosinicella sp. TaxID=2823234 RepID=UPI002FC213E4
MTRFGEKIGELPQTLDLVLATDLSSLAQAIGRTTTAKSVIAVGSGGSAIAATYFARCRETLFGASTETMTPMDVVVGVGDLQDTDVWLFSAGADNPDFRAALHAARVRRAKRINLVTRRQDAVEVLGLGGSANVAVHVIPVANEKDSFLATHSLVSSVSALLLASNMTSTDPVESLADSFQSAAMAQLDTVSRRRAAELFSNVRTEDTLLIIADPQLAPATALIETSLWEAAICTVQQTDFRNFAHGRHSWLHHRPHHTVVLALTGHDTAELWDQYQRLLPPEIRQITMDFGNCGRFQNAVGIMRGLVWIEAMGRAVGIDPGKPGIGEFGRSLYGEASLEQLSGKLGPAVRQKRRARLERDDPACGDAGIHAADRERLERLAAASIGGIVFDYDGTIVPTDQRETAPDQELVEELKRLHLLGVRLAIATGRGGSAGEKLREVLPPDMQQHVIMGYYNGGYIKSLDVDIRLEPPPVTPEMKETAAWLTSRSDLFIEPVSGENSRVQITIQLDNIPDLQRFNHEIATCDSVRSGAVRVTRSGHSVDLILARTSKTNVAERLSEGLGADIVVLRVGDQGSRVGNDNELLTHPYGVSVNEVCGRDDGCWSLFGADLTGPDALLRLLKAMKPDLHGNVRIDIEALQLDADPKTSTNREHALRV